MDELVNNNELSKDTKELVVDTNSSKVLNVESREIINKIIEEQDVDRQKDLTQLFNVNQNKKTIVRMDKLNALMDAITDQTFTRLTTKPDEISNKELLDSLKIVQDLIDRGSEQINNENVNTPLIQINQQNNEVNLGDSEQGSLNRDSRERVKTAVLSLLNNITQQNPNDISNQEIINVENAEIKDSDEVNNEH